MNIAITGHRPKDMPMGYTLDKRIVQATHNAFKALEEEIGSKDIEVYDGLALGFDQLAAEVALRRGYRVIGCIPLQAAVITVA